MQYSTVFVVCNLFKHARILRTPMHEFTFFLYNERAWPDPLLAMPMETILLIKSNFYSKIARKLVLYHTKISLNYSSHILIILSHMLFLWVAFTSLYSAVVHDKYISM